MHEKNKENPGGLSDKSAKKRLVFYKKHFLKKTLYKILV